MTPRREHLPDATGLIYILIQRPWHISKADNTEKGKKTQAAKKPFSIDTY